MALALPVLVVALGGGLRLVGLDHPDRLHFDEAFYVADARSLLERGVEEARPAHPPVGKWLIAAGMAVAGDDPAGWRVAGAVAGTLTVGLTAVVGLRLLGGSLPLAALAALVVALDGLALTMSRTAMLDVFLGLFVLVAAWCLVRAHDARTPRAVLAHRVGAGVALGLGVGTKWSGALAVLAALVVVAGGAVAARRAAAGAPHRRARRQARPVAAVVGPLLVVPALVYVASYAGWFGAYPDRPDAGAGGVRRFACPAQGCDDSPLGTARAWVDEQVRTVRFHQGLVVSHPDRSDPAGWPVLARPVLTYLERCAVPGAGDTSDPCVVPPGTKAKILAVGNPGAWWPALLAYPVVAWGAVVRRRWAPAAIGAFLVLQWAPWLASPKDGYLFYLTPVVPFVGLALAHAVSRVPGARLRRAVGLAAAALVVAGAALLLPLWLGWALAGPASDARLLLPSWR